MIHKRRKPKNRATSYRSLSLLLVISKIMEMDKSRRHLQRKQYNFGTSIWFHTNTFDDTPEIRLAEDIIDNFNIFTATRAIFLEIEKTIQWPSIQDNSLEFPAWMTILIKSVTFK